MIQLDNVSVSYGRGEREFCAVKDVSLHVPKSSIQGIIGFSGAGKSTLLRSINLLERPSAGRILIDGTDLTILNPAQLREARHNIGMIFQHFNLVNNLTVRKNVELALKFAGVSRAFRKEKARQALEIVDLASKENAYPGQLSGGQKQRVAIARALAPQPQILLCDEPTSAVDPRTTGSILQYLKDINTEFGITTVLVTHEMNVVKALADEIAILEGGALVEQVSTKDIRRKNFIPTSDIGAYLLDDSIRLNPTVDLAASEPVQSVEELHHV